MPYTQFFGQSLAIYTAFYTETESEVKKLESLGRAAKKRDTLSDKVQLQLAGILDMREPEIAIARQSPISEAVKAIASEAKSIAKANKKP